VTLVEPTGAETYVLVQGGFGEFTLRLAGAPPHRPGDDLRIGFDPTRLHLFDASTGERVG
jgi:multiple sugar transport system ATP-binding protein